MRTRKLVALSAAVLSALLLAGCASAAPEADPTPTATEPPAADLCASAAPSGSISEAIVVTGDPGSQATVEFESPLEITSAERTVVVEGEGDPIESGDLVEYGATIFDATTGELIEAGGYDSVILPVPVTVGSGADQFFGCATEGSRIVMTLPATEQTAPAVWVLDVLGTAPLAAWGEPQEPVAGMPTVELAEDGQPTVTLPEGDMPTEFAKATLKKGDGPVVAAGDGVIVQYHGVSWDTGEVFDESWGKSPFSFTVGTGVVQGFSDAVAGETVGSQVIAVLPPSVAYGEGEITDADLKGQTLVFVIDILAAQSAMAE